VRSYQQSQLWCPQLRIRESFRLEKTSKVPRSNLIPPPACPLTTSLSATSLWFWNTSRVGDFPKCWAAVPVPNLSFRDFPNIQSVTLGQRQPEEPGGDRWCGWGRETSWQPGAAAVQLHQGTIPPTLHHLHPITGLQGRSSTEASRNHTWLLQPESSPSISPFSSTSQAEFVSQLPGWAAGDLTTVLNIASAFAIPTWTAMLPSRKSSWTDRAGTAGKAELCYCLQLPQGEKEPLKIAEVEGGKKGRRY